MKGPSTLKNSLFMVIFDYLGPFGAQLGPHILLQTPYE